MKISGIYGIKNIINGKWYIGQTIDLEGRKITHFSNLKHGNHCNPHLQYAFKKHGRANFEFHVLEKVAIEMLDVREIAWISYYKSTDHIFGYNMFTGGHVNRNPSEEVRRKISIAGTGRHPTEATRAKLRAAQANQIWTEEKRKKISLANKGKKRTLEVRRKLSQIHAARFPKFPLEKVIKMYSENFSCLKIAKLIGSNREKVRQQLLKAKVLMRIGGQYIRD